MKGGKEIPLPQSLQETRQRHPQFEVLLTVSFFDLFERVQTEFIGSPEFYSKWEKSDEFLLGTRVPLYQNAAVQESLEVLRTKRTKTVGYSPWYRDNYIGQIVKPDGHFALSMDDKSNTVWYWNEATHGGTIDEFAQMQADFQRLPERSVAKLLMKYHMAFALYRSMYPDQAAELTKSALPVFSLSDELARSETYLYRSAVTEMFARR